MFPYELFANLTNQPSQKLNLKFKTQKSKTKSWKSKVKSLNLKVEIQKLKVKCWKSKVKSQKTKVEDQKVKIKN